MEGLSICIPVSATVTGGSISVNNGAVSFSTATDISLSGVFTSLHDIYIAKINAQYLATTGTLRFRLTQSGIASDTGYTCQQLIASGTNTTGSRTTPGYGIIASNYATVRSSASVYIFGPNLAQPTAMRSIAMNDELNAATEDVTITHSDPSVYDGIMLTSTLGVISGSISIYGFTK